MPTVIIGVAAAVAAAAIVEVGIAIAIGVAVAIATDMMMPDVPSNMGGVDTSNQNLRTESNPPRLMIVGEAVTSGPITKYEKLIVNETEFHLFVTPLADHPCESVELYQLDGVERTSWIGSGYRLIYELGNQTEPNTILSQEMVTVDENFVGFGITYVYHRYEINPDIFPNGVQDVKFKVKGIAVYDPRKDSTVGGSGTHRANDETTWEWSDNAALVNLHWKRFGGDYEIPVEMFDIQNLAYEASLCDEEVTFTDAQGTEHTEKRWTCNGIIDLNQGQRLVEEELLKSCGGRWVEAGGKFWLLTAAYRGPATVTLTDDDLKDDISREPYTAMEDRCNAVTATFINPKAFYQQTTCTEISSTYYETVRDKRYLLHKRELGYTNSDTMCQRLNRIFMEQVGAGDTLKIVVGWRGIKCPPGTVVSPDFKEAGISGKEYEVIDYDLDPNEFLWTLTLKETGAALYDDSVIPAEKDLLPNTTIDNTLISEPYNVQYTETPADSFRQGVLTWQHETPLSLRRFSVEITRVPDDGFSRKYYPTDPEQNITNLPIGTYQVAVRAQNRFEKSSDPVYRTFAVNSTATPSGVTTQVLTGKVIVPGPPLPHDGATYDWRYAFNGDFATSFDGGRDVSLTIHDTPDGGSVTIWYRLIDGERADPNWTQFVIGDLTGLIQITDNGNGSYTLSTETTSIIIRDGNDGSIPTVTDNGDGSYTIEGANGQTITISDGDPGYSPIKGTDYFDGLNGDLVSYIFRNSATKPSTPTGGSFDGSAETFPSGWTDTRTQPGEGVLRWISSVRYKDNGNGTWTKKSAWSEPAPDFEKGDTGPAPTVQDNGNGSYTITSGENSITIFDGAEGDIPTFTDNGDGSYTITNALGETITVTDGEDGNTPVKGVDYFDGLTGDYVSFIYRNASSQPATPTGGSFDGSEETFPSGATDTKTTPSAGQKRWVSTVRYKDNGNGTWSRRTAWSAYSEDFERGEDGASGKDGLTPDDVQGVAGQVWGFTEDGDYLGWNLVNLNNSSVARGALHATATTNDPYIEIDGLSIVGADNYGIKVRLRTSSATFDTSAQFYWETSTHGINSNYRCEKVISYTQNEWTYLIFDIRDAVSTSARDDWMNNVITGIRVDFANSGASGKTFEIDHVVVGYFGSALMPVDDDALPAPSNLIGNPMGAIADRHGRAQGWKPCEGGFEYDKIRYYSGRKALRCGTQTYTNQAIAYKAVAVSPHNVYRLRLLLSSEYVQTQGLYIRLQELNTEMPAGKTHIVHATWASTPHGVARTSYKEFLGNNGVDDQPQLFEYDYTPPAGVKYVSLAIYRWSGQPGWTGGAAANIWIHHAEFFVKEATSAIRNDSISLSSDGFMTYQDENGNPVSSGAVTRAGLGAESPSGAQARADAARTAAVTDAYNQAIASALLRNPSGEGMNFFPPMYQNPLPEVPFGGKNSTTTTTVVTNNQGQPSGGNIIGVGATGGDAWVNLSTSGDNMKIVPGKKWLIRFWVKNNSSVAAHSAQVYFSWSTASGRKYLGATYTTPAAGASGYRQVVLDMRSSTDDRSSATAVYIRLDNDGGNGSMLYFDNFMVEPIAESEVNNASPTPSPYSAPLGTAPILSNGYLPMNTNAGQSTQSIQPLATSKYNNAARITINAHTLYTGDLGINYSTGHIDGLAYSTVYYIYCDDPYSQGGTPPGGYKYVDAASYQDLSKSSGRYWIGAKKTVSSGGTTPPPDDDFNCVAEDMYLVAGLQAKDCQTGDILDAWNPDCGFVKKAVKHRPTAEAMCIAIRTESGAYTEVSFTTPIDLDDGRTIIAANAEGEKLLVLKEDGSFCWERVVSAQLIGEKTVVKINCGDVSYASGSDVTNRIVTHNAVFKP